MKLERFAIVFTTFFALISCKNTGTENDQTKKVLFPVCKGEKPHQTIARCNSDATCKWGYIYSDGTLAIEYLFDWADVFSEGLARVKLSNNGTPKWGYIDETGCTIIVPQFDEAFNFSEGLAKIRIGNTNDYKYGFINKKGNCIINPIYDDALPFSEGLAVVGIKDENNFGYKYGFIDKTGNYVIEPNYTGGAYSFTEGLAAVAIYDNQNHLHPNKYGFIDKSGQEVIAFQFDEVESFSEGLAAVIKNGRVGFVDKGGDFVLDVSDYYRNSYMGDYWHETAWAIGLQYWRFNNGIACIREPRVDSGTKLEFSTKYVNKKGEHIGDFIPPFQGTYTDGRCFSEGLAAVKGGTRNNSDKYGYIDSSYNLVIDYQFDDAEDFNNGLARVLVDGKMAYINKQGIVIWREP